MECLWVGRHHPHCPLHVDAFLANPTTLENNERPFLHEQFLFKICAQSRDLPHSVSISYISNGPLFHGVIGIHACGHCI